jgi:hypothetical protein
MVASFSVRLITLLSGMQQQASGEGKSACNEHD